MRRIHRKDNKRNKIIIISVLFISLISLTIGYSSFNTKLSINTKGNIKKMNAAKYLKTKVVTTGDGLYQDSIEQNKYFFKGTNPDNWITFDNDLWRIININKDGTIRIIKSDSIGEMPYDIGYVTNIGGISNENSIIGTRYTNSSDDYCYQNNGSVTEFYGCNIWSSNKTTFDKNGNIVTKIEKRVNENIYYNLPSSDSYLNTYLNNVWYESLNNKSMIVQNASYNIGLVNYQTKNFDQNLKDDINQSENLTWKGKVATLEITDYPRTNSNITECGTVNDLSFYNTKYNSCKSTSWLYNKNLNRAIWSLNPESHVTETSYNFFVLAIRNTGDIANIHSLTGSDSAYPVLTLKSNIKLSGSGKETDPYIPTLIE